jgi:uncharacterized protein YndB with AHSA1/START domain
LTLAVEGDHVIVGSRGFAGSPGAVYRAHLDPALVPRWLLGPPGWTMPVCILEARPGGRMRYEWVDGAGHGFHLTGEFLALEPSRLILHVERMHLPETTPDNRVETLFEPDGEGVLMTVRMTLPDAATCETMMRSGMQAGMEQSYGRLDTLL